MKQVVKRNEESTITNFVKKSGSALIDIASKVGADLLIAYIKSIQGL